MNTNERIKMLKAMEFIARNVNNESFLNGWLALGVADGDIEYGDLSVGPDDADELEYYMEDEPFADLQVSGCGSTRGRWPLLLFALAHGLPPSLPSGFFPLEKRRP